MTNRGFLDSAPELKSHPFSESCSMLFVSDLIEVRSDISSINSQQGSVTERQFMLPLATPRTHEMLQKTSANFQQFLDRLTSRSVLTEEEQQAIRGLPATAQQVSAHRDFVRLDQFTDHACLLVDGVVGRFGQNSNGDRQITALYIAGDMPDLHSVVQPKAGSALQALSTTTILRVPHKALREVAEAFPAVAVAFWRECAVDAAILSQWVVNVGRRDARARMAHLLCEMAVKNNGVDLADEVTFPFPVTQTQLADCTGLTAVHVNRTLQGLRAEGLAHVGGRAVRIPDWENLAEAGQFDPGYLQVNSKPAERIGTREAAA